MKRTKKSLLASALALVACLALLMGGHLRLVYRQRE